MELVFSALQADSLPAEPPGKPFNPFIKYKQWQISILFTLEAREKSNISFLTKYILKITALKGKSYVNINAKCV